jgi:hypothetical protein
VNRNSGRARLTVGPLITKKIPAQAELERGILKG